MKYMQTLEGIRELTVCIEEHIKKTQSGFTWKNHYI